MKKIKNYSEFINESVEEIFRSAHGAIDTKKLKPLKNLVGKPKFPTREEFDEAVEFLEADPDYFFYNEGDFLHPVIYWKDFLFYGFFGGLRMDVLKMMRADAYFQQMRDFEEKMLAKKDYDSLFGRAEKKILIPAFVKVYDQIPDSQKYDIFTDLYTRSEYGFQMFPLEIIKSCFSFRKQSKDWKTRMKEFSDEVKPEADGKILLYRGQNTGSAHGDDAFSWTTSEKTAKFFADRFSKGSGSIVTKKVNPSEVIDYLQTRGESEVILFPKKFGALVENNKHIVKMNNPTTKLLFSEASMSVSFFLQADNVKVFVNHANMGSIPWFDLDKDSNFSTTTNAKESWVVDKLFALFKNVKHRDSVNKAAYEERKEQLFNNNVFSDWWKDVLKKYRGTIAGKKYGI